jgi:hypothetical protein
VPGGITGPPCSWGHKYGDLALQVGGVSKIGNIKYAVESHKTPTREGLSWRGPAATENLHEISNDSGVRLVPHVKTSDVPTSQHS